MEKKIMTYGITKIKRTVFWSKLAEILPDDEEEYRKNSHRNIDY